MGSGNVQADPTGARAVERGARPRVHSRRARCLVALIVLALASALGCSTFTNRMLLHPSHHVVATSARRSEFVGRAEPIAGQAVELFYQEYGRGAGEPELFVLALTGNAGRAESMQRTTEALFATWLGRDGAPAKIGVLSLQYPGYGVEPEGSATLESLTSAAAEAVEVLRERAGSRPIFLHALSMGTVGALYATRVARAGSVQGLVLAKPPNLGSMLVGEYGWWNLWLIAGPMALWLPDCAESADNAAAIEGVPALFLIAEEDRVVPERYARQVFEAYAGPKRRLTVPGAHNTTVRSRTSPDLDDDLDWLWSSALAAAPVSSPELPPAGD